MTNLPFGNPFQAASANLDESFRRLQGDIAARINQTYGEAQAVLSQLQQQLNNMAPVLGANAQYFANNPAAATVGNQADYMRADQLFRDIYAALDNDNTALSTVRTLVQQLEAVVRRLPVQPAVGGANAAPPQTAANPAWGASAGWNQMPPAGVPFYGLPYNNVQPPASVPGVPFYGQPYGVQPPRQPLFGNRRQRAYTGHGQPRQRPFWLTILISAIAFAVLGWMLGNYFLATHMGFFGPEGGVLCGIAVGALIGLAVADRN